MKFINSLYYFNFMRYYLPVSLNISFTSVIDILGEDESKILQFPVLGGFKTEYRDNILYT